jgi:hypothetical protein
MKKLTTMNTSVPLREIRSAQNSEAGLNVTSVAVDFSDYRYVSIERKYSLS